MLWAYSFVTAERAGCVDGLYCLDFLSRIFMCTILCFEALLHLGATAELLVELDGFSRDLNIRVAVYRTIATIDYRD